MSVEMRGSKTVHFTVDKGKVFFYLPLCGSVLLSRMLCVC